MKITMSQMGLLPYCAYSFRPEIPWPFEKSGKAADSGKRIHTAAECLIEGRPQPYPGLNEEERIKWAPLAKWLHANKKDTWRSEVPLSWSWKDDTARFLPKTGKARDYASVGEFEVAGTIDILDVANSVVKDIKTGQERDESQQLITLAHAASKALGIRSSVATAVYAKSTGVTEVPYDVPQSLDDTRERLALIPYSEPQPGDHCDQLFCKARKVCPTRQPGWKPRQFSLSEELVTLQIKPEQKREPMSLYDEAVKGVVEGPFKMILHGGEGLGKSTFASKAPAPVWLGADGGTKHLKIDRGPLEPGWEGLLKAVSRLTKEEHPWKTLVIDPLNWFEEKLWDYVCKRDGKSNIDDYGFFKGQRVVATAEWRVLIKALDELQAKRGMNVILIAHPQVRKHKNPTGDDYDRFGVGIFEDGAALFRQWADYVFFCRSVEWTEQVGKGPMAKYKGKSTDLREMRTTLNAAYDAKSRPQLPDPLPLEWVDFVAARDAVAGNLEKAKAEYEALLPTIPEESQAKAKAYILADPENIIRYEQVIKQIQERSKTEQKGEQS